MPRYDSTCWTLVRGAAAGSPEDKEEFAVRYAPVLRAYLAARWRVSREHEAVADATQEVFLQCFKEGSALERVDPDRPGGFRAFLYGVARNVARDLESRGARSAEGQASSHVFADVESSEATLSQVFDRAWARMLMREARRLLSERLGRDEDGVLRLHAMELRYHEGLKSGEIAERMGLEPDAVYQMLHRVRKEFRAALMEVVSYGHPTDTKEELEQRCLELLSTL